MQHHCGPPRLKETTSQAKRARNSATPTLSAAPPTPAEDPMSAAVPHTPSREAAPHKNRNPNTFASSFGTEPPQAPRRRLCRAPVHHHRTRLKDSPSQIAAPLWRTKAARDTRDAKGPARWKGKGEWPFGFGRRTEQNGGSDSVRPQEGKEIRVYFDLSPHLLTHRTQHVSPHVCLVTDYFGPYTMHTSRLTRGVPWLNRANSTT